MILRVCAAVLLLVAGVVAQDDNTTTVPVAGDPLGVRYNGSMADNFRRRHFYCNLEGNTQNNFPMFTPPSANTDEDPLSLVWSIFLQYPVLSYLDSNRKEILLRNIARLVQMGSEDTDLMSFNETDFCIGRVYHYRVADYEESVLVNFFFRNESAVISIENQLGITIPTFNNAFLQGFENADSSLVQQFEGRSAIVVDATNNPTEMNQHPGVLSLADAEDPTMRAIFLQSFPRPITIDEAATSSGLRPTAENPNPTNFGLEPGDIVFAVFGSIFLTAVGALILLGFCIHPFFLA